MFRSKSDHKGENRIFEYPGNDRLIWSMCGNDRCLIKINMFTAETKNLQPVEHNIHIWKDFFIIIKKSSFYLT